jgi:recombination protein RecA
VKVVKNKLAAPFRDAEFEILFNEGISKEGNILDLAVDEKLIRKSGAWFSLNGENMGQGREATRQFLKDNPAITEQLREQIIQARGLQWGGGGAAVPEAEEVVREASAGD